MIGYAIGIKYNSEGSLQEWLLNTKGEKASYNDKRKICKSIEEAERYVKRVQKKYSEKVYYREYFSTTYI